MQAASLTYQSLAKLRSNYRRPSDSKTHGASYDRTGSTSGLTKNLNYYDENEPGSVWIFYHVEPGRPISERLQVKGIPF